MREWIPVSTSAKGRLALAATREFGARPFSEVTVGELAAAADVTTGAIYHHFESKLGLYVFVRRDIERRLVDRMEGSWSASASLGRADAITTALVVGFDFAVRQGFLRLLGETPIGEMGDPLAEILERMSHPAPPPTGRLLAAAWRAAVLGVGEEVPADQTRAALLLVANLG